MSSERAYPYTLDTLKEKIYSERYWGESFSYLPVADSFKTRKVGNLITLRLGTHDNGQKELSVSLVWSLHSQSWILDNASRRQERLVPLLHGRKYDSPWLEVHKESAKSQTLPYFWRAAVTILGNFIFLEKGISENISFIPVHFSDFIDVCNVIAKNAKATGKSAVRPTKRILATAQGSRPQTLGFLNGQNILTAQNVQPRLAEVSVPKNTGSLKLPEELIEEQQVPQAAVNQPSMKRKRTLKDGNDNEGTASKRVEGTNGDVQNNASEKSISGRSAEEDGYVESENQAGQAERSASMNSSEISQSSPSTTSPGPKTPRKPADKAFQETISIFQQQFQAETNARETTEALNEDLREQLRTAEALNKSLSEHLRQKDQELLSAHERHENGLEEGKKKDREIKCLKEQAKNDSGQREKAESEANSLRQQLLSVQKQFSIELQDIRNKADAGAKSLEGQLVSAQNQLSIEQHRTKKAEEGLKACKKELEKLRIMENEVQALASRYNSQRPSEATPHPTPQETESNGAQVKDENGHPRHDIQLDVVEQAYDAEE